MPKISVITPTARGKEAIELVERALKRQTFRDFEWIVQKKAKKQLPGDVWSLNKDYNKAIRKANGELIVSWQDWTFADPDALEKFWRHYEKDNKVIVSGVGNKYKDDTWMAQTWQDPRQNNKYGSYYGCYFMDIEWNFAALPRKALYAVGGFDEWLDQYYGMDGYSVNDRLNMVGGWDFRLDQTNKSYSLEHGRPKRWDEKNAMGEVYLQRRKEYLISPVLPYLTDKV